MKLISFIITYHNEPLPLLRECVESILSLPMPEDSREILLVDDGSDVPVPQMDGVNVVRQENQGLSAARNHGLELARGEYIQFVDADDCLISDAYGEVLQLQREHRPDMVMFRFTHGSARTKGGVELLQSGTDFLLTRNVRAAACAYMFRRSVLGELRFYPGILHEDELFTPLLLLRIGKLVLLDSTPYYYRLRPSTITHLKSSEHVARRLKDTLFVLNQLQGEVSALQGKARSGLDRRVCQLAMAYVYVVWRDGQGWKGRIHSLARLRECGLYPLPVRWYTWKYWLFSLLTHIF